MRKRFSRFVKNASFQVHHTIAQVADSLGVVVSLTTDMVQINELPSFEMSAQVSLNPKP
jgi:hypothetical protein